MDLEDQMEDSIEQIDVEIQEIQEEINILVNKKKQLVEKKNSLKAHKYLQKSFELSNKDWDKGESIHANNKEPLYITVFSSRNLQMEQAHPNNPQRHLSDERLPSAATPDDQRSPQQD